MQLKMYRPADLPIPDYPIPEGFTIREMREGEEACWAYCCLGEFAHEVSPDAYNRSMAKDPGVRMCDVFYACIDDKPVATCTARTSDTGEPFLHYVACNPDARGHGITYPLISKVLQRHAEFGRYGCALTTDDPRLPAIKIYLKMGFLPVLREGDPDVRTRWGKVIAHYNMKSVKCVNDDYSPNSEDITVIEENA